MPSAIPTTNASSVSLNSRRQRTRARRRRALHLSVCQWPNVVPLARPMARSGLAAINGEWPLAASSFVVGNREYAWSNNVSLPDQVAVSEAETISVLIDAIRSGDLAASDRLFARLYDEFKSRAHLMLRAGPRQTLCTTELVNETWMRLQGRALSIENRAHFSNLAARAMRQVLIDRARHRNAQKRGDGAQPITLSAADDIHGDDPFDVLALDQVMSELAKIDQGLANLAQLHLFGGLTIPEIAELNGTSDRTVFRQWRTARMYLVKSMAPE